MSCIECHGFRADAPHMRTFSCDRRHPSEGQVGPLIDCRSCRSPGGLHTHAAHSPLRCTTCHAAHEWTVPDRSVCLGCHVDIGDPSALSPFLWIFHAGARPCREYHDFGTVPRADQVGTPS